MDKAQYQDACARSEHQDRPARLRNIRTGEMGTVIQCSGFDVPEAFLVKTEESVIAWSPEEVEEVVAGQAEEERGAAL